MIEGNFPSQFANRSFLMSSITIAALSYFLKRKVFKWSCLAFVLVSLLGGMLSGLSVAGNTKSFYQSLKKPFFAPPPWLFGPVWTVLYILMGIASHIVWLDSDKKFKTPLIVYFVQLVLNFAWSPVFFGLQTISGGLVLIILIYIAAGVCTKMFWQVDKIAGILMLPYMLWLTLATVLNFELWRLN
ncbi:hypothetical protein RCL1_000297 [Eukaryota sp. TZLM3-RCL]